MRRYLLAIIQLVFPLKPGESPHLNLTVKCLPDPILMRTDVQHGHFSYRESLHKIEFRIVKE